MSPEIEAAIIAGGVGVLTVIAALYGTRKTSRDTRDGLNTQLTEQREALDKTLKEQHDQLDKTLAEQRTRTLNERFATAAEQLGSDKPAAVRLAGVYAMAGLADDWKENRQTCVDVLCAYLRMPYEPNPGEKAPGPEWLAFRASREVRHTVIRVITAHLNGSAAESWRGLNFDFTGVVFDGGDFGGVNFFRSNYIGGEVSFVGTEFSVGTVDFKGTEFPGGTVDFKGAKFSGGTVDFGGAKFSGGTVDFSQAEFSDGAVFFMNAKFSSGTLYFSNAQFSGGAVRFDMAGFSGSMVYFTFAKFSCPVSFFGANFSGGRVGFSDAQFSGGEPSGGLVAFEQAKFSGGGGVTFEGAEFGGTIHFTEPGDWSFPPEFPWTGTPPPGVTLPKKGNQSQS